MINPTYFEINAGDGKHSIGNLINALEDLLGKYGEVRPEYRALALELLASKERRKIDEA